MFVSASPQPFMLHTQRDSRRFHWRSRCALLFPCVSNGMSKLLACALLCLPVQCVAGVIKVSLPAPGLTFLSPYPTTVSRPSYRFRGHFGWSCPITSIATSRPQCLTSMYLVVFSGQLINFPVISKVTGFGSPRAPQWDIETNIPTSTHSSILALLILNQLSPALAVFPSNLGPVFYNPQKPNGRVNLVLPPNTPVPGPPAGLMMLTGLALIAPFYRRHRRKKSLIALGNQVI